MKWNDLSMTQKSELMKIYVSNGITRLDDIIKNYNEFDNGGPLEDEIIPAVLLGTSTRKEMRQAARNYANNVYAKQGLTAKGLEKDYNLEASIDGNSSKGIRVFNRAFQKQYAKNLDYSNRMAEKRKVIEDIKRGDSIALGEYTGKRMSEFGRDYVHPFLMTAIGFNPTIGVAQEFGEVVSPLLQGNYGQVGAQVLTSVLPNGLSKIKDWWSYYKPAVKQTVKHPIESYNNVKRFNSDIDSYYKSLKEAIDNNLKYYKGREHLFALDDRFIEDSGYNYNNVSAQYENIMGDPLTIFPDKISDSRVRLHKVSPKDYFRPYTGEYNPNTKEIDIWSSFGLEHILKGEYDEARRRLKSTGAHESTHLLLDTPYLVPLVKPSVDYYVPNSEHILFDSNMIDIFESLNTHNKAPEELAADLAGHRAYFNHNFPVNTLGPKNTRATVNYFKEYFDNKYDDETIEGILKSFSMFGYKNGGFLK